MYLKVEILYSIVKVTFRAEFHVQLISVSDIIGLITRLAIIYMIYEAPNLLCRVL